MADMQMYPDLDALPDVPIEPVATIGNFDGVHRGHQAILARLQQEAARVGAPTMVITFFPHPRELLRPEDPFDSIMSLKQRLEILWDLGVDHVLVLPFDHDLAELTAREFIEEILWDALRVRAMYVGPDTAFGHNRSGDVRFLASEGRRLGFSVGVVDPIIAEGRRISSSWVRRAVQGGHLELAAHMLGRQHRVAGVVVQGHQRGRELGFPTANLLVDGGMLPPAGVYAAWAHKGEDERLGAVVNIGHRPTFEGEDAPLTVEAHLLNFEGELYDEPLSLALVRKIRDEAAFPTAQQLKMQIRRDALEARRSLGLPRK